MTRSISRRELLQGLSAANAVTLFPAISKANFSNAGASATNGIIYPLTSTSDVYTPPRGKAFFKLSYDFPEPSVEFEGFRFSFLSLIHI